MSIKQPWLPADTTFYLVLSRTVFVLDLMFVVFVTNAYFLFLFLALFVSGAALNSSSISVVVGGSIPAILGP